ncbi:MAG: NAD(+)/NADH kinase [Bacteroidota bacterium]|nr:NAD(+)/NADH kinase [Bacteroidota bacterium]MDP4233755.1 NAD(+)/NADH kinase [Bacteroidota bacterium]MDP4242394.1 NAD(+)/NADH kinase [Bacteroidota bacterium]MDP4287516.1 NAD(+)/NADH kinase [Bacteroidota bacterium]
MMRFGIFGHQQRAGSRETLTLLLRKIVERFPSSQIVLADGMASLMAPGTVEVLASLYDLARTSDVIFSIGGDGTMLMAARAIERTNPNAKLVGINLGKLGFISEHPPAEMDLLLDELASDSLVTEHRLMLRSTVSSETTELPRVNQDDLEPARVGSTAPEIALDALNEIVIDNYGSTRMLTFEIFVNDALLGRIRADGIIIATPTGSTGYAVSAGGPIIEPTSRVMLVTPIAPHSLNIRPIIVPEEARVRVRSFADAPQQALVVADGQEQAIVRTPSVVTVQAAPNRLKLLRRRERSYFDLLRTKLFWSADTRDAGSVRM